MSDAFADVMRRARAWFQQSHDQGWLTDEHLARLERIELGTPADLFVDQQARPLVVAFFGGTGVGKSSLLNRLAGDAIARVGVERPTSREVTLYMHSDVKLAELPEELPVEFVRVERHRSGEHRDVLWIDAPDIDSTEETNRKLALAWLPHTDVVCYVVSPERYRDDAGWRVLLERGHRHGWLFVMNRWDEADPRQAADFARMLGEAGFDRPVLLRTSCLPAVGKVEQDDFDELRAALRALLEAHGVRELARLGHRARLQELRSALVNAEKHLGDEKVWQRLEGIAAAQWQHTAEMVGEGATWTIQATAARFATKDAALWEQVRRLTRPKADNTEESQASELRQTTLDELVEPLWDDWTESKLQAWLDEVELAARRAEVAAGPLRGILDEAAGGAAAQVRTVLGDEVRTTLARPGHAWRRVARRMTGFLTAFLPAVALLRVTWAVVQGYETAARRETPFLGTDFVIHSTVLVLLAWAVPFTMDRLLRPSLEQVVRKALQCGLALALEACGLTLLEACQRARVTALGRQAEAQRLLKEVVGLLVKPIDARSEAIGRLMMQRGRTARAG